MVFLCTCMLHFALGILHRLDRRARDPPRDRHDLTERDAAVVGRDALVPVGAEALLPAAAAPSARSGSGSGSSRRDRTTLATPCRAGDRDDHLGQRRCGTRAAMAPTGTPPRIVAPASGRAPSAPSRARARARSARRRTQRERVVPRPRSRPSTANSSSIAAWPSNRTRCRSPASDATASKSRPTLEVRRRVHAALQHAAQRPCAPRPKASRIGARSLLLERLGALHLVQQPSRRAPRLPDRPVAAREGRNGRKWATRSHAVGAPPRRTRRPRSCRRGRSRCRPRRRRARAAPARSRPCRPARGRRGAGPARPAARSRLA